MHFRISLEDGAVNNSFLSQEVISPLLCVFLSPPNNRLNSWSDPCFSKRINMGILFLGLFSFIFSCKWISRTSFLSLEYPVSTRKSREQRKQLANRQNDFIFIFSIDSFSHKKRTGLSSWVLVLSPMLFAFLFRSKCPPNP